MANLGNTGQRYKMTTIIGYEQQQQFIIRKHSCGHDGPPSNWETPEKAESALDGWLKDYIGKKTRCDQCQKQNSQ